MTRYETFIMVMRRTAGTLGIMVLICWLFFLVGLRLIDSALPKDTPQPPEIPYTLPEQEENPEYDPPIDEKRPNCIRMEDGDYVCEKPEEPS
jgi:hypothetical protein